jgi:hypothetical protein
VTLLIKEGSMKQRRGVRAGSNYFFKPCDQSHTQRGQGVNNLSHSRKSIQVEDDMRAIITATRRITAATAIVMIATVATALTLSPTTTINALLGRTVVSIHTPLLW